MTDLTETLTTFAPFADLDATTLGLLEEMSTLVHFEAGQAVFRSESDADSLFLLRDGQVALEITVPSGGPARIDTLGSGEVLGISWMLPPYRWTFDARCVRDTSAIRIDALQLRAACEADHELGYTMFSHLAGVVRERLQAARMQVLDMYGNTRG